MEKVGDGIFIQVKYLQLFFVLFLIQFKFNQIFYKKKENILNIPQWAADNYDKITQLGRYMYHFYYLTSEQARLGAGGILKQFRSNIEKKVGNTSVHTKLFLYSGHDTVRILYFHLI